MTDSTILPDVEFKATPNGQFSVDEAKGIVECFVAAIGNKDSVGDIILPGAFDGSLKRRKPRVVWGHNWNEPIGKVLDIQEVPASDPRIPMKMKQAGVGGLFARVQFNLKSERGREAFSNVVFFGEEQEWSIGYKTLNADFDPTKQANLLREVELYEVSPVLHGANQLTATISIKSDSAAGLSVGDLVTWNSSGGTAYGKVVKKKTNGMISAEPDGPSMGGSEDNPALGVEVWKQDSTGKWVSTNTITVHRMQGLRKLDGLPSGKSASKEDQVTSFGKSKWKMFDRTFAERIKSEHSEIWRAGGNIKGNDQYEILTKIAEQGGVAKTPDQVKALELREAWVARHKGDFRLPGVIAQIKWLAIGTRGESYMKKIVAEAIDRREKAAMMGDIKPEKAQLIIDALTKKMGGNVDVAEIRDTEIDFEFEGKKWTIPWADLAGGNIVFAEPTPFESQESPQQKLPSNKMGNAYISLLPEDQKGMAHGGMDPEEVQLVVKSLGNAEEWHPKQREALEEAVKGWAHGMGGPLMGRFHQMDTDDDQRVMYRVQVPKVRELEEEASRFSTHPVNERQKEQYESTEELVEKYGKFDQGTGPDGAHYVAVSPFKGEGLACSNCVYYQGPRGCEVVSGDIDPDAVCKLWIIPENLVKEPKGEKSADMYEMDEKDIFSGMIPVAAPGTVISGEPPASIPFTRARVMWGPTMREFNIGPGGKPGGCGCGCGGKGNSMDDEMMKADLPGAEANSSFSAEVLKGRGPRRGNLEKLLRYWRPIMKKKGGFRRCVAELMDHPELAPWKPLCAWLHHETTGKWPNEGNHHGGGKAGRAARRALKGRKSGWSDEYGIKSAMGMDEMGDYIVDEEDKAYAIKVLKQFCKAEPEFMSYLQDEKSWVGLDDDDNEFDMDDTKAWINSSECVDCEDENDDMTAEITQAADLIGQAADKVGRRISSSNMAKLQQAVQLLNEIVGSGDMRQKHDDDNFMVIDIEPESMFMMKSFLDPIADYYDARVVVDEAKGESISIEIKSVEQVDAIERLFFNDEIEVKGIGNPLGAARRALGSRSTGKALGSEGA